MPICSWILLKFIPEGSPDKVSSVSSDGLLVTRWQAINLTNDDQFLWCHMESPGINELKQTIISISPKLIMLLLFCFVFIKMAPGWTVVVCFYSIYVLILFYFILKIECCHTANFVIAGSIAGCQQHVRPSDDKVSIIMPIESKALD